jgi:hypothetical protein
LSHLIIRIKAPIDRSPVALESHAGLPIIDIDQVQINGDSQSEREQAARQVHRNAMERFLKTEAPFAVVLEDDAILTSSKEWMLMTEYDFFIPFAHNRIHLPIDTKIREGKLPKYGAFAYLCSRKFAENYFQALAAPGLADVISHEAARGLRIGSYTGNSVNHDNEAISMISETRRIAFLEKHPDQVAATFSQRLMLKLKSFIN